MLGNGHAGCGKRSGETVWSTTLEPRLGSTSPPTSPAGMRRYIPDRDWLTVFQLPFNACGLNPDEVIWPVLRCTTTADLAFADSEDRITAVRRGLRQLQYGPASLDGCLTGNSDASQHDDVTHSRSVAREELRTLNTPERRRDHPCRAQGWSLHFLPPSHGESETGWAQPSTESVPVRRLQLARLPLARIGGTTHATVVCAGEATSHSNDADNGKERNSDCSKNLHYFPFQGGLFLSERCPNVGKQTVYRLSSRCLRRLLPLTATGSCR